MDQKRMAVRELGGDCAAVPPMPARRVGIQSGSELSCRILGANLHAGSANGAHGNAGHDCGPFARRHFSDGIRLLDMGGAC
jgi:hypothetical protein